MILEQAASAVTRALLCQIVMADVDPTDVPPVDPLEKADAFGPPHEHTISETLQLWILIPGLIGLVLIGETLSLDDF